MCMYRAARQKIFPGTDIQTPHANAISIQSAMAVIKSHHQQKLHQHVAILAFHITVMED